MKLFIDCGTNLGQGLTFFNKKYNLFNNENWHIYTFEANKHIDLKNMFLDVYNIEKIHKAIWINDGELNFTSRGKNTEGMRKKHNEGRLQGGGSHISDVRVVHYVPNHVEIDENIIECIDFNTFLNKQKDKYEKIIVKMDIEGAEFEIIDHLISNNSLSLIDEIYIETHGRFKTDNADEVKIIEKELLDKCKKCIKQVHHWS
tara:strand:- start:516 stop:1121 length:606 start_codon:yes stop_codon:yes gene_type:complete